MDEKECRLHLLKDSQVFAKKGSKRIHVVRKEHGENVAIVTCDNATGYVISLMILFDRVMKNPAWEKGLPSGSKTNLTPKGCINTETFVEFCEFAEENVILLHCLSSNTRNELQPLDKGCFRTFEIF